MWEDSPHGKHVAFTTIRVSVIQGFYRHMHGNYIEQALNESETRNLNS